MRTSKCSTVSHNEYLFSVAGLRLYIEDDCAILFVVQEWIRYAFFCSCLFIHFNWCSTVIHVPVRMRWKWWTAIEILLNLHVIFVFGIVERFRSKKKALVSDIFWKILRLHTKMLQVLSKASPQKESCLSLESCVRLKDEKVLIMESNEISTSFQISLGCGIWELSGTLWLHYTEQSHSTSWTVLIM